MFLPQTGIKLLSGVELSKDHQMSFANETAQKSFFLGKVLYEFDECTYVRASTAIKLQIPLEQVLHCDYLMYQNLNFGNKWFYAYILECEYVNPTTTLIYFQIDVFQTFYFQHHFLPCFVEREMPKQSDFAGRPIINTLPEGLDIGSDYYTHAIQKIYPYDDNIHFVVITTSTRLGFDYGAVQPGGSASLDDSKKPSNMLGVPQQFWYYIVPFVPGAVAPIMFNRLSSSNEPVYGSNATQLDDVLLAISTSPEFVGSVVDISISSFLPISLNVSYNPQSGISLASKYMRLEVCPFTTEAPGLSGLSNMNVVRLVDSRGHSDWVKNMGNKYAQFPSANDTKLYTYPYSFIELTDFRGNSFPIHVEHISGQDLIIRMSGTIGTDQRTICYVDNYNGYQLGHINPINGIIDNNQYDIPIKSDYAATYIQANRGQLKQAQASLAATAAMQINNTANSGRHNVAATAVSGLASIPGAAMNGADNGLKGMAKSSVGAASQAIGNTVAAGIRAQGANENIRAEMATMQSNLQAEQLAKMQDIQAVPPTIGKLGSNTIFDIANGFTGYYLVWKTIKHEYREIVEDYFHQFGWKTNRVKIPYFGTRKNWNFIKTNGCKLQGSIPKAYKKELEEMYDAGITIWHDSLIGQYDRANPDT